MPHATISMYPGHSEEEKRALADKVKQDIMDILGSPEAAVSVSIRDIPAERWKAEMWDTEMRDAGDQMYVKPGYNLDDK